MWRVIVALLIVVIAISTTFNAVTVALPKLFAERLSGLTKSPALLGAIAAGVYVFGAMTQYTIGKLIDRHSLKAVSLPLSFVLAPFLYLAAELSNLPLIIASIGIVMGAFGQVTVNDAMVGKYTSEEWRSRAYAVRYFVGFTAAGASVGLVAWLYQQGGFVTMLHAFAGLVSAGDRGGDHPADRDQGAGRGRELSDGCERRMPRAGQLCCRYLIKIVLARCEVAHIRRVGGDVGKLASCSEIYCDEVRHAPSFFSRFVASFCAPAGFPDIDLPCRLGGKPRGAGDRPVGLSRGAGAA